LLVAIQSRRSLPVIAALAVRVLHGLVGIFRRRRRDGMALPGMPRCNAINPAQSWMACQRIAGHSDAHQVCVRWARDADEA
jgi:hypothetical protein